MSYALNFHQLPISVQLTTGAVDGPLMADCTCAYKLISRGRTKAPIRGDTVADFLNWNWGIPLVTFSATRHMEWRREKF